MEFGDWGDSNDSWIWDVDDLQNGGEKSGDLQNGGEKSGDWEWGDSNDSWIWDVDVDDLQYGGN
jgi:hypothetical protein